MKHLAYLLTLTLVMIGCGSRSGYFKIEGRLLNLNQGEFYVYSTDGVNHGIDTIKVEGGRFAYETPCTEPGTLVMVFPNYSELPVIAAPGKTATISGDASHLKEIEVKGTDENKLMTAFRQQTAKASPPDVIKAADKFVTDNPNTLSAVYVLRRYFITDPKADVDQTLRLVETVHRAQPKNGNVARMSKYIKMIKRGASGTALPRFTVQDINGRTVSDATARGKVTVVLTWASWSYESRSQMDRVKRLMNENKGRLALIAISLDASSAACRRTLSNDSTAAVNICDQQMFDSPLLEQFALTGVPDNIIFNAQGRIIGRSLTTDELEAQLKTLL